MPLSKIKRLLLPTQHRAHTSEHFVPCVWLFTVFQRFGVLIPIGSSEPNAWSRVFRCWDWMMFIASREIFLDSRARINPSERIIALGDRRQETGENESRYARIDARCDVSVLRCDVQINQRRQKNKPRFKKSRHVNIFKRQNFLTLSQKG
jgi:hypothetical protein